MPRQIEHTNTHLLTIDHVSQNLNTEPAQALDSCRRARVESGEAFATSLAPRTEELMKSFLHRFWSGQMVTGRTCSSRVRCPSRTHRVAKWLGLPAVLAQSVCGLSACGDAETPGAGTFVNGAPLSGPAPTAPGHVNPSTPTFLIVDAPGNAAPGNTAPGNVDPAAPTRVPRYVLHVTEDNKLLHLSIDDATATQVCDLDFEQRPNAGFCSLTFNREDRLFASTADNDGELWEIELPSCRTTRVGAYGAGRVCGITPAPNSNGLLGVSLDSNNLLAIDENTGASTEVGPLGENFGSLGATWVDQDGSLRAISGAQDSLFTIDQTNGNAAIDFQLDLNFSSVGMEYHPQTGKVYACTNGNPNLLEVSLEDGTSAVVGDSGLRGCNNLGAPFAEPVLPPLTPVR